VHVVESVLLKVGVHVVEDLHVLPRDGEAWPNGLCEHVGRSKSCGAVRTRVPFFLIDVLSARFMWLK
jgi:hypothetical protein